MAEVDCIGGGHLHLNRPAILPSTAAVRLRCWEGGYTKSCFCRKLKVCYRTEAAAHLGHHVLLFHN